ncbi:MAG: 5-formyltetrahydrofolate cyclo-ligase [Clostridia bacterium]|nr:5-formyltetrahydrofolate cyclo-ligase [Clostridia bacterium]
MERISEKKAALRSHLRKMRRELDREVLFRESAQLCARLLELPELQRAQTVFCYVSYGGEVETHRLIERLLSLGKQVLVPRGRAHGVMDCVPITSLAQLVPGMKGILEPPAELRAVDPETVEFAVIPAVGCGEDGSRLGQGGGYYDRFLERASCSHAALCLEAFLLPSVPAEPHDQTMKYIVTQQRVLRFEEV